MFKFSKLALVIGSVTLLGCGEPESNANSLDTSSYLQPGGYMYFFENGMPNTIFSSKENALQLNQKYAKDGDHSLSWEFVPGATLSFNQPIGYRHFVENDVDQSISTFSTWIYNDTPQKEHARFAFGTGKEVQAYFDIDLNFSGWRHLLIPFRDMEGSPSESMDFLQVNMPENIQPGTLYFDQLMPSIPVDPRWPTRDKVVPFINTAADSAPNRHWLAHYLYNGYMQAGLEQANATKLDSTAVATISKRLDSFITQGRNNKVDLADIQRQFDAFELQEIDGYVAGKTIGNGNRLKIFLDKGVNKGLLNQEGYDTLFDVIDVRNYSDLVLQITRAMNSDVSAQAKKDLTEKYILLTRFALDQGYEAGSGLGTSHHIGYGFRPLFEAHFLNRDVLEQNGLLTEVSQMMSWFSNAGRIFTPENELTNFNVDIMNTQLRAMLYSILMQPNEQVKAIQLAQFSQWLSKSIVTSEGMSGGFKVDGSVFHHIQHYPAYASGALKGVTPVVEALSKTSYAIDTSAHEQLKHVVAMGELYSFDQHTLMSVAGRHPTGLQTIDLEPFQHLAKSGSPDGKQPIDIDMAQAYLRLARSNTPFSKQLAELGIESAPIASGNWAMNFASLSLQRRDGWMAGVRGFSRYLVGNESYANANRYGRYINYGQLEIMSGDSDKRAFSHDGWDWNRWPGITSVQLPFEQLNAQLRNVDRYSGLEEMLLSEQSYAGGLSHRDNGMYALKLQGHPKYDGSFYANKSVFFFDDRIVALGSDITTEESRYPTQTTLFQHAIRQDEHAYADGHEFPSELKKLPIENKSTTVLIDPANNAYVVPHGQSVSIRQGEQHSVHQKNSKPTKGSFATAVIDHGNAPESGSYQYVVLVDSDEQQAKQFAELVASEQSPIEVLQQNTQAHIVWDRESSTKAFAIFEAGVSINDELIKEVDVPAMLMASFEGQRLALSVVNPDFSFYQGIDESQYDEGGVLKEVSIYSRPWKDSPSQPVKTNVTLKGQWKSTVPTKGVYIELDYQGNTLLTVTTVNAQGVHLNLEQI
ncbi:chondroitin-sulfate-ABC endolyase/exolyase [Vibrio hangzhouensis]|uniref:Chondroitin sulfate ABC lyase n=2 Tax=Vibrio hangzhouensis TaxID=462991 RepID=A0A1H6B7R5_9VIBR|nr:chondroitin-sulfate-ABC endolyase/exolyase [Vibrio hangzhouensis]